MCSLPKNESNVEHMHTSIMLILSEIVENVVGSHISVCV